MDALLIIITIAIVVAIGYILSRPFFGADAVSERPFPEAPHPYERQYQDLLREIKTLEAECQAGENDKRVTQIEILKEKAANLLRLIDVQSEDDIPGYPADDASQSPEFQPEIGSHRDGSYICPQCGSRVIASDKFCPHCGHQLQP
jgi:rubrerythrin